MPCAFYSQHKSCGKDAYIGYNCPSKVLVISNPEPCNNQTIDELPQTLPIFHPTFHSEAESLFTLDSTPTYVDESPNVFNPPPQPPVYPCEFYGNDAYYGHYCTPQAPFIYLEPCYNQAFNFRKIFKMSYNNILVVMIAGTLAKIKDQMTSITSLCEMACQVVQKNLEEKQIEEERAAKAKYWKLLVCYDDDDDEERSDSLDDNIISGLPSFSAITPNEPVLSTEEPDNSISMGDEHLDTNSATKSDEFIKFGIENLIPIPSEPEDDVLCKKLRNVNLLISKIKALNANPTSSFDCKTQSSSTSLNSLLEETNTFDNSLPEFKTFCFDVEEISSGSTTTSPDISLSKYEVFHDDPVKEISSGSPTTYSDSSLYASVMFDLSINLFPPADRSDSYEFTDELIPFISAPEYDCFLFKVEPNSGDFTKDVVEDISPTKEPQVLNALPTHPTLQLNMKFQPSNQIEDFSESTKEFSSIDDDSLSIENIDYAEASPPDSELVSSEVMEIVIPEVGGIDDDIFLTIDHDILREKLLNVNLLIAKIEALNANPTPSSDCKTKSSSTSLNYLLEETNTFNNSLPEIETFCFDVEEISSGSTTIPPDISLPEYEAFHDDHVKEISSGSPTTPSDISLSKYDSFIFDLSINPFPPSDRSDSYEFTDELIPFISAPEYDCFRFTVEPNSRDFTKDVVENISPTKGPQVLTILPTHPSLQLNMKFQPSSESLFTYVVWIFLPFLVYSVVPHYLLSLRTEDIIFDPGICNSYFSRPDISHRCGPVKTFNTHRSHLNKCPMLIHGQNNPPLDVLLFHFYPP
nr:hypothetical protein [Tanacetum cinerariifolium]